MAHGGKREGAGKPKGATAKRTQEAVNKALAIGITPLEVMLEAMKEAYDKKDLKEASNFAKDAAPYVHAKLQSTTISGDAKKPLIVTNMDADEAIKFAKAIRSEYLGI